MIQIPCRRRKNNPLLVGEAGVGKTAIAEGLASRIVQKEAPEILAESNVYSLDMGALLAGTKYRGDRAAPEGVLRSLKDQAQRDPVHRRDPHADRRRRGLGRHARRVQPAQAGAFQRRAEVHWRHHVHRVPRHLREDHALSRRFQKVDVVEPTVEQTVEILKGLKSRFEEHHSVKYAAAALAAELSAKYINDRHLPRPST